MIQFIHARLRAMLQFIHDWVSANREDNAAQAWEDRAIAIPLTLKTLPHCGKHPLL